MSRNPQNCGSCRFFGHFVRGKLTTPNLCRRYPGSIQKSCEDWCGEFVVAPPARASVVSADTQEDINP